MKIIEIKIFYNNQPPTFEQVPETELAATLEEISLAGIGSEIIGEVSWQRQLAQMENPPL